ncbi:MAG: YihY/virulence factor BrkB family protein [Gammaproteobacteria bacterium]|nr:YihY/virulence factor BrkB family protein [Gammaproteobacteria bacterium]
MTDAARRLRPLKTTWLVLVDSAKAFAAAEPFRLAAALSYYTLLSMAPLLLIVIGTAGFFFGEGAVRNELIEQIRTLTGEDGASLAETVIANAENLERSIASLVLGGGLMLFGATTVFAQLQGALNEIWHVKAAPANAVVGFLRHRLLSFALILVMGFLLMISLVTSAVLAALQAYLGSLEIASITAWQVLNTAVSFGFAVVLIAMIFKYLPDALIAWRDVWFGAFVTALLFVAGKYLIGLYLGQASIGSAFGAAGSVVVFMVWVYYAGLIFFFGAEITQAVARHRGERVRPSDHGRPADDADGTG